MNAIIAWANQTAGVWLEGVVGGLLTVLTLGIVCALLARFLPVRLRCWLWWLLCARLAFAAVSGFAGFTGLPIACSFLPPPSLVARAAFVAPRPGLDGINAQADPALPAATQNGDAAPSDGALANARPTVATILLLFWAGGVLVSLALSARDAIRLRRLLRETRDISTGALGAETREIAALMGVALPPKLLEASQATVSSPFVAGMRWPVLVVPHGFAESVTPDEARMALAHELAHLRRGDLTLALVPLAARILCFCIPLVPSWTCREWATAREADCDVRAMQATLAAPGAYSRLLMKIVRGDAAPLPRTLATLGATTSFHTLRARLHLIRDRSSLAVPPRLAGLVVFGLLALAAVVPWRLAPPASANPPSPNTLAPLAALSNEKNAPDDIADVSVFDTHAGGGPNQRYLLIGAPKEGAAVPPSGYHLIVVLPGGDGGEGFSPFVRRLHKNALGETTLVAQLIAPRWDAKQFDQLVWPTQTDPWPTMRFSTEEFVEAVVRDVEARFPIDKRRVFTLAWASGGQAAYATSLRPSSPITGSFIAMSVFHTETLPPLAQAKGRAYFILHPENAPIVPVAVAQRAQTRLRENGATVELVTYPGGYGWSGDVFGQVRRGVRYLEDHAPK